MVVLNSSFISLFVIEILVKLTFSCFGREPGKLNYINAKINDQCIS